MSPPQVPAAHEKQDGVLLLAPRGPEPPEQRWVSRGREGLALSSLGSPWQEDVASVFPVHAFNRVRNRIGPCFSRSEVLLAPSVWVVLEPPSECCPHPGMGGYGGHSGWAASAMSNPGPAL